MALSIFSQEWEKNINHLPSTTYYPCENEDAIGKYAIILLQIPYTLRNTHHYPLSLSLAIHALTRAEAGPSRNRESREQRRYCSPSQRLPPSGLILIYVCSGCIHHHFLSLRDILPIHTTFTVKHRSKRHASNATRQASRPISALLSPISYGFSRKRAFTHQAKSFDIPTLLPSLNPPHPPRQDDQTPHLSPGKTQTLCAPIHVN
jgi:hypothetical protein